MLIQGLHLFAKTSGLQAHKGKSEIYQTGMEMEDIRRLSEVSGFTVGTLPFKYLGVPISAKQLSSNDCEKLVDKMMARIKIWKSRNLRYTGRL